MKTDKQQKALQHARRYRNKNYLTTHFGKQYLTYCDDAYVRPSDFLQYVQGSDNVVSIKKNITPAMEFDRYFDLVIGQAMRNNNGKAN